MDINSFLAEWVIKFLENKDAISKKIVAIDKKCKGFDFSVQYKDSIRYFIVKPRIDKEIFNVIKANTPLCIISLNNPNNIKFLVNEWKKISEYKALIFYFVNPFSNLDKAWIIMPYVHNRICDNSSLELGLKSMAEMVESISLESLNDLIRKLDG